ncbi:hypothetical protein [Streptomyces sp. NPDC047990]|uniref:hypothetical protein n=1 Tax=Streptomyces sp. NPDC047990 TaxID=3365496 RepID=UPI003722699E
MTSLTSTSSSAASPAEPPAQFSDLRASEWIKMRSLRSTPWTLALTTLFVIGSAAVSALAENDDLRRMSAAARTHEGFHVFVAFPPAGYMTLMLVAGSIGALAVVSEYSSGLIATTTVAVPARGAVTAAKAVVTAALWTARG